MSHPASHQTQTEPVTGQSQLNQKTKSAAFLVAIGAIVLIGSEIWLVAIATIWALHGLFATSIIGDIVLAAIIVPPALWATWKTVLLAIDAERMAEDAL